MLPPEFDWLSDDLAELDRTGLRRRCAVVERRVPGRVTVEGQEFFDFGSNDYLGLAADPRVARAARDVLEEAGFGSTASPLVSGYHRWHRQLETDLADFEAAEAVLLFTSGLAANVGVLSAIVGGDDVIFSEKRNHASLIDGCRLSGAKVRIYRSDELEKLQQRLADSAGYRRRLIVTDSVFSMDGDLAPLVDLCDLAERYEAILYVDEAHATGVLGAHGRGLAELLGVEHRISLRLGTLGKALGGVGGFLVTTRTWADWLLNHVRSYIYSTALPPVCAAAMCESLRILRTEPERITKASHLADALRTGLREAGYDTGNSQTPIVPVLLGDPSRALELAAKLRRDGFWCPAIRPPTVPTGTSRLRITTSAAQEMSQIQTLLWSLGKRKNSS